MASYRLSKRADEDVAMIEISHHGATTGVTGYCDELTVNSGDKNGV